MPLVGVTEKGKLVLLEAKYSRCYIIACKVTQIYGIFADFFA
jgi:hypothetical protein